MLKIHSFLQEVKVSRMNFFGLIIKKRNSIAAPIIYTIVAALLVFNFSYFSGFNQKASQLHAKAESIMTLLDEVEETNTSALFTTDIKQYTFSNLNLIKNKSIIDYNKMNGLILTQTFTGREIKLFPLGQSSVSIANKANREFLIAPGNLILKSTAEVNKKSTNSGYLTGQYVFANDETQLLSLENDYNSKINTTAVIQTQESVLLNPLIGQVVFNSAQEEKISFVQEKRRLALLQQEQSAKEEQTEKEQTKTKQAEAKQTITEQQDKDEEAIVVDQSDTKETKTNVTKEDLTKSKSKESTKSNAKSKSKNSTEETVQTGTVKGLELVQNSAMVMDLSSEEIEILQRIVEAEATGEDIYGKILVANVVLNRVNSKKFPNTVEGVVFQKSGSTYQFSPVKDGRFWSVKISSSTKEAVERALGGEDYSQGAFYFFARKLTTANKANWFDGSLERLFKYGSHEFYKNK